jgi:hypothetical protein
MPARLYIRKTVFGLFGLGLLLVSASAAYAQEATTLRVRPLVRDGQVLVTFALDGGLTDEMKAAASAPSSPTPWS